MHDDYATVLRLVDSRLSLPVIYAKLRDVLCSRMPAANMYVSIREADGIRFPYYMDEHEDESSLAIHPKNGWTGHVIDLGKRYWFARERDSSPVPPCRGTLPEDWIGLPLFDRDGVVLGMLAAQTYKKGESFSDGDADFLEYCAFAVSLAIQLAMLDRELAIRRIAALVEETVDVADLYPKIHEAMNSVIRAARRNIIMARVDEAAGVFRPVYWINEKGDYFRRDWPLDRGFSGYIYSVTRESFIFDIGKTDMPKEVVPLGYDPMFWLGSPLFSRDTIIGIVIIQSYDPSDPITKEDQYALDGICPYIATAINHTEMFKRLIH